MECADASLTTTSGGKGALPAWRIESAIISVQMPLEYRLCYTYRAGAGELRSRQRKSMRSTRFERGAPNMRRAFFGALAYASLTCMSAAQPYPTRPITLIVPYGAGGPLDILTRIVSERMRVSLGQPIVIDNVTGASGVIGVGRVVRADPDGYTVSVGNWPTHVVNGATFTLQYDLLHDLEPVALLSSNPYVVVARNELPAKNLQELIAVL